MHEMRHCMIDDPVVWASVSLSVTLSVACHTGNHSPDDATIRSLLNSPLTASTCYCLSVSVFDLVCGWSLNWTTAMTNANIARVSVYFTFCCDKLAFGRLGYKQYGSSFRQFDMVGFETYRFQLSERHRTTTTGHNAVQGHSKSPILLPVERPYATSLVNHTKLHRFRDIANYR